MSRPPFHLLLTCAGRKVSLVNQFRHAFEQLGLDGRIIGVDSSSHSAVLNICDKSYVIPRCDHPEYVSTLLDVCHRHHVDLLMPLIDVDLLVLAEHREQFQAVGTLALISSLSVVQTCRDKERTARFFVEHQIPTVQNLSVDAVRQGQIPYPVFIKPTNGSGSQHAYKVHNREELEFFLRYVPRPMLQEFAVGQEYTVDVLCDLSGQPINAVPRRRLEVRAGEISKGVTCKDWRIINASVELAKKLGGIGPLTFQCFAGEADDSVRFTEINPRVGGGLPLSIAAGANYPEQILRMALGETVTPCLGNFDDEFYMFRYEEGVYVPGVNLQGIPQCRAA
jgi:carbamoyl-phosphate synthase large subunit